MLMSFPIKSLEPSKMKILLCIFLLLSFLISAKRVDNYSLVRLRFTSAQKLDQFNQLFGDADIWSNDGETVLGHNIDVMLSPEQHKKLVTVFLKDTTGVAEFQVLHKNVQQLLDQEKQEIEKIHQETQLKMATFKTQAEKEKLYFNEYFKSYHKYEEMALFVKVTNSILVQLMTGSCRI